MDNPGWTAHKLFSLRAICRLGKRGPYVLQQLSSPQPRVHRKKVNANRRARPLDAYQDTVATGPRCTYSGFDSRRSRVFQRVSGRIVFRALCAARSSRLLFRSAAVPQVVLPHRGAVVVLCRRAIGCRTRAFICLMGTIRCPLSHRWYLVAKRSS